jgi:hypothetical protein
MPFVLLYLWGQVAAKHGLRLETIKGSGQAVCAMA